MKYGHFNNSKQLIITSKYIANYYHKLKQRPLPKTEQGHHHYSKIKFDYLIILFIL